MKMKKNIMKYIGCECVDKVTKKKGMAISVFHYDAKVSPRIEFQSLQDCCSLIFYDDFKRLKFVPNLKRKHYFNVPKANKLLDKYMGQIVKEHITNEIGIVTGYQTILFDEDMVCIQREGSQNTFWTSVSRVKIIKLKKEKNLKNKKK